MFGRFIFSNSKKICGSLLLSLLVAFIAQRTLVAQQKPSFTVGWSVYVGWDPYYYMAKSGILKKWADKYGIDIRVQRFDYAPSLDAFVAKNIDACAMTNMEALDMPAAAGVDTTAVVLGDYSNGNDAVITRQNLTLAQIPGKLPGEIDPVRIDATLDVVKSAFKLATPVTAADVYAPGFVP